MPLCSMHGGAGGIMSIGLMRKVSLEFMEACTKSLYSTGAPGIDGVGLLLAPLLLLSRCHAAMGRADAEGLQAAG